MIGVVLKFELAAIVLALSYDTDNLRYLLCSPAESDFEFLKDADFVGVAVQRKE